uniref:Exocyst subunit Exo70 family protein n=1 Tax=Tanacetum cinerariifolium TaxID=118510 RepID=A0A6L2MRQ4_TANCI|nr:exocyst complex component EXO70A1-like [Tanacetum cinerariifolium]
MGFDDLTMKALRDRAATMKDCLARSQVITDSMTSILGSFDLRLSAFETAMRQTQIKTHSMRRAHENIDKTLKFADAVLVQFDLVKQAETIIMRGPHEDLESYLQPVNQLKNIVRFFSTNKNLKSSVGVITQATTLLQKSSFMLEEEFRQLLYACSKPVEPDRLFDCLPASLRPSTNQVKQLFQEFQESDPDAQLAKVTTRIMQALQNNLDGKSKQYKDQALTQLFMMNNIHYIVRSVRRSEAKDMLGEDWVQIHRRVVQQYANQYKRISWSKILQYLTVHVVGNDETSTAGVSRENVKEIFKTFNTQFEELHQRQSQWSVPDSELRESLRLAVDEVLLPAYRSYGKRFGPMIEGGKNPSKYIRFTPEDLERMLAEFFEGKTASEQRR